jgi:hypothetical protein
MFQKQIIKISLLYLQKKYKMETTKKSKAISWVIFFASIVAFFGVYAVAGGYCSMVLPVTVTAFAMALDLL